MVQENPGASGLQKANDKKYNWFKFTLLYT